MKSFKDFLEEKFIRPNPNFRSGPDAGPQEHDEVKYQGIEGKLNDKMNFRNALRTGKVKTVPAYHFRNKGYTNTEAGSDRPARDFQSLDQAKRNRVNSQVAKGKVEMPIVRKKDVLAGNTRATRMARDNRPTQVLDIGEAWNRVSTDKLRGPHQGKELDLMLNHGKPAALLDNDEQLKAFQPHIDSGRFMHKKIGMGPKHPGMYGHLIVHAGDHYRMNRLEREFGSAGRDHVKIGTLLGYSKDAIRHFINVPPGKG